MPDADKRAASLARQLALLFIGEARRGIPLGHIETFLLVAADEGRSVGEYAQMADVSKSVMSRQMLDIGDATRSHEPGLGWVTARIDPMERRKHEVILTPVGRVLARRVRELLDLWVSSKERE